MPNIQLASNLRFLRKANHLTQDYLSDILNISRQAYSNYENSKRTPDLDSLMRLSKLYQVSLDHLVYYNLCSDAQMISEGQVPYNLAIDTSTSNTIYLTEEETRILSDFRSLSADNQKVLLGFLDANTSR